MRPARIIQFSSVSIFRAEVCGLVVEFLCNNPREFRNVNQKIMMFDFTFDVCCWITRLNNIIMLLSKTGGKLATSTSISKCSFARIRFSISLELLSLSRESLNMEHNMSAVCFIR